MSEFFKPCHNRRKSIPGNGDGTRNSSADVVDDDDDDNNADDDSQKKRPSPRTSFEAGRTFLLIYQGVPGSISINYYLH